MASEAQQAAGTALLQALMDAAAPVSAQQPAPVNLRRNQRQAVAAPVQVPVAVAETGLPAFPHAVLMPEQSTRSAGGGVHAVSVILLTSASLAQVKDYYLDQFQPGAGGTRQISLMEADGGLDLRIVDTSQRRVQRVLAAAAGPQVAIQLSRASSY